MAIASKRIVTTTPTPRNIAMSNLDGRMIQLRVLAKKAVNQNAASEIPASPKVACVQAFTPSQCGWSAIPRKNGPCQTSHARLRRNEKTRTLNSGVLGRPANHRIGRKIFTRVSESA
jgi:hypothetical protein